MIRELCRHMKVGERVEIAREIFQDEFPCGWPTIYRTYSQAFLSSQIGSAWRAWKCHQDPISGNYIVSHHEPGNTRVYIDPDREHLWKR